MFNLSKKTVIALCCTLTLSAQSFGQSLAGDMGLENEKTQSPTLFFHELKLKTAEIPNIRTEAGTEESDSDKATQLLRLNTDNFLATNKLYEQLEQYSNQFGARFADYISKGEVVTGYQMHLMVKIFSSYHMLSVKSAEFADYYAPGSKQSVRFLDVTDVQTTKRQLIWLASRMSIIDNLWSGYRTYYKKEGKVRRMLKSIYKISKHTEIFADELKDLVKSTFDKKAQKNLSTYVASYESKKQDLAQLAGEDEQIAQLLKVIDESKVYTAVKEGKRFKLKNYSVVDGLVKLGGDIVNAVSGFFGNIAGSMRWRKGWLWHNQHAILDIESQLKPLDIIFEKTPFALTDKFIPGHFGHAAIWLGTESELKELGMWDHPAIAPYQEQIRRGYSIVEALRPGVSMNSVRGFSNIDHIAIVRVKDALKDKAQYADVYERALRNMGKDYDFNFDVSTADKIVCSELVFQAFGYIKFPTSYRFGRPTIEPDLVAEVNFYDNSPTEFRYYVESFAKDDIQNLPEQNLGKRLGFVVNQSRSTPNDLAFDREATKCRLVKRKVRDSRLSGANTTLNRTKEEIVKVCTHEQTPVLYVPPVTLNEGTFSGL